MISKSFVVGDWNEICRITTDDERFLKWDEEKFFYEFKKKIAWWKKNFNLNWILQLNNVFDAMNNLLRNATRIHNERINIVEMI